MRIPDHVLPVLENATTDGARLVLNGQLDRKTYTDTDKVLQAIGGKWDRKAKAHIFDGDAEALIGDVLVSGEYFRTKQDFGQFDTPSDLAERVVAIAGVSSGSVVLEPSAGIGRIAHAARAAGGLVTCYEIDPSRAQALRNVFPDVFMADFLGSEPDPVYTSVVMNPPFSRQADIDHVIHAFRFLAPGGRLVAIMSASVAFRQNAKTASFREMVSFSGGTIESLPDGTFRESGTMVNTVIVTMNA